MKRIKLLYLADREALARWGRTITTDTYVSMKHRPMLSQVFDLITEGPNPVAGDTFWTKHISEPEHFEVSLKSDPSNDLLSEAGDDLLDEIFRKYGRLNRWQLVDLVHGLPEWKDPNGGAFPIQIADILRAQNGPSEDIRAIEEDMKALDQVNRFLAAR